MNCFTYDELMNKFLYTYKYNIYTYKFYIHQLLEDYRRRS